MIPGTLHFTKITFTTDCPDDEELLAQLKRAEGFCLENPNWDVILDRKRGPVTAADLAPQQCLWQGDSLICNFGPVSESGHLEMGFYVTAGNSDSFQAQAAVWRKSQGPESALLSPLVTGSILATAKRLVYPWISNNESQFESVLVVNNYGSSNTQVQLTGYRREGMPETIHRTIPARGSLRERASLLFPGLGSGPGYSVVVESSEPHVSGHWVTNNLITGSGRSPSQGVAVDATNFAAPWSQRLGKELMFGYLPITGGLTSAPVVINLGDSATDVTLKFYDANGVLVLEDRDTLQNLEPLRPFATVINNLVPDGSGDLHMTASAPNRLTGVVFVFNEHGEPAIGNVQSIWQPSANFSSN